MPNIKWFSFCSQTSNNKMLRAFFSWLFHFVVNVNMLEVKRISNRKITSNQPNLDRICIYFSTFLFCYIFGIDHLFQGVVIVKHISKYQQQQPIKRNGNKEIHKSFSFATCRWYNWAHVLAAINKTIIIIRLFAVGMYIVYNRCVQLLRLLQKYTTLRYSYQHHQHSANHCQERFDIVNCMHTKTNL